ncbi:uncharacterized protein K460DRAFT_351417 [Cucurbitaria berberidis CBS 394.84]|uniref:Uncharacterized protein n=1 Tax=Cucurbitaria berberidis CBS 394.84 TaxID=1168544 RepID=A0A9P4GUC0_9PLEO|nr:uncharacterized protein K460DRAFT_351417 [Cucurbitaria berberidis CBS 394.84]KAF1851500.1 hypothetical protein K460DRAFT_351417 [Cucurbitaria berberidis CBS 394.84]
MEDSRPHRHPVSVDLDGMTAGRHTNSHTSDYEERLPQKDRATPTEDRESAEETQSTQRLSTLSAVIPQSTARPSTLRATFSSSASSFVLPASSLRAAIPTPEPSTSTSVNAILPSRSSTTTTTVLRTIIASPSRDPVPTAEEDTIPAAPSKSTAILASPSSDPTPAEENTTPVAPDGTTSAASALLVETTDAPMTPIAKAGMGVGLTFSVLSIASIAGFFLWRRRRHHHQNQHSASDTDNESNHSAAAQPNEPSNNILAKFFHPKKYTDNKHDAEWSVESAQKVEFVKDMHAQSVRTASRGDSRGGLDGGQPGAGREVMNESGMLPRRKLSMPNMALGSHPITPDVSAFPAPPTFAAGLQAGERSGKEEKRSNWPLME